MSTEWPEPADDFERHARTWSAQEKILENCRQLAREHGLGWNLIEDLEEAYSEQAGTPAESMWWPALERFTEALAEAKEDEEGV